MYIAIFIAVLIVSAVICHMSAKNQGENAVFWGMMGATFGSLAIPFIFIIKGRRND